MTKYRKKPIVIEAIQYTGTNFVAIGEFMRWQNIDLCRDEDVLIIDTLEGEIKACPGDYIIKGVSGEFYPCKPDIFEKTYEPV